MKIPSELVVAMCYPPEPFQLAELVFDKMQPVSGWPLNLN